MLGRFAGRAKTWSWRHPSRGVLLSLQDGELSGRRRARILSHLEGCSRCRANAARIKQEWKRIAALASTEGADPVPDENDLLARIQASIRAWSATSLTRPQTQTLSEAEARRQMEAVLEVYLGKRAAIALLQAHGVSPSSRQDTLTAVDSALAALLGRKGATVVSARLRRIVDQVPESTH
jgi:anti-sigma factor RsiW